MARYIDADKFLKDETKRCGSVPSIGSCTTDNESLAYVLAQTPTADVVEVVRCKDCSHRNPYGHKCLRDGLWHDDDDFCSYGERKTDNDI